MFEARSGFMNRHYWTIASGDAEKTAARHRPALECTLDCDALRPA